MFSYESDNISKLKAHNITISELKPSQIVWRSYKFEKVLNPSGVMQNRDGRAPTSIRITSVMSIQPPNPDMVKKQEEDKLRAQLQKEIVSRSRSCAYKGFECTLPVLSGRQYCYRHILRDVTAPFRQCTHTYGNGERCQLAFPCDNPDVRDPGLCYEHARAVLSCRQRQAAPAVPVVSSETFLHQLTHHVRPERTRTTSCASSVSVVSDPADQDLSSPTAIDPFRQINGGAINSAHKSAVLECCSESDSDADSVVLGAGGDCRMPIDAGSEAEDASTEEMPLWRAGIYTAEEAVGETKNTLKLLQAAYFNQMGRLKALLQTARLQYLKALKPEKEQYCSINSQARSGPTTVRERSQLRKLKAYASYHRKHGVEAVLNKKLQRKRAKGNDTQQGRGAAGGAGRCTFSEGGVRCEAHSLPAAKHCTKHILHDKNQVLFAACESRRGLSACREPVPRLPLSALACRYHTVPPVYTVFTLKKDETETESECHSSSDETHTDIGDSTGERSEVFTDPQDSVQYQ